MRNDMIQDAKKRKTELLLPAKDLEVLKTAVRYGADAVYIGGEAYGLRAKARNFSPAEMAEGIRYAHERGVKVYVTANILAHNSDLAGAEQYFGQLAEMKPDAILVADPGMFMLAKKACPEIPLHISTQANNTNYGTFQLRDLQFLVRSGSGESCLREGTESCGDRADPQEYSGGQGDRGFRARGDVHLLFGKMPSVQLFHGQRRQSRRLHAPLQMEVRSHGGVQAGRLSSGRGK